MRPGRGLDQRRQGRSIDQAPIGRTPRSNPATYTGVFAAPRPLRGAARGARARGYKAGRFSFNVKGGRCEACQGDGVLRVEMHFLPGRLRHVRVVQRPPLQPRDARGEVPRQVHRRRARGDGRAGGDALRAPAAHPPTASTRCRTSASGTSRSASRRRTLSGGEAQRVKLARELSRRDDRAARSTCSTSRRPGLHFADVEEAARRAAPISRRGQHGGRHRAQPRRRHDRRLGHRPRPRWRRRRR